MLNEITIHGYLGRSPELKEYRNAKGETNNLVNFSVGVSRDMGDETDWFDVTFFGRRAEVIEKFFSKGSQIIVTGRMQSDTVEKDGRKHKYWKLIGSSFDFCDSKGTPRGDSNLNDLSDSFKAAEDDIPF
jgi:single-strand DNA-binding protein